MTKSKFTGQFYSFSDKCDTAQKYVQAIMATLGEEAREEIVIPFCNAHKVQFLSGGPEFMFVKGDRVLRPPVNGKVLNADLEAVEKALMLTALGHPLGCYVESYEP